MTRVQDSGHVRRDVLTAAPAGRPLLRERHLREAARPVGIAALSVVYVRKMVKLGDVA